MHSAFRTSERLVALAVRTTSCHRDRLCFRISLATGFRPVLSPNHRARYAHRQRGFEAAAPFPSGALLPWWYLRERTPSWEDPLRHPARVGLRVTQLGYPKSSTEPRESWSWLARQNKFSRTGARRGRPLRFAGNAAACWCDSGAIPLGELMANDHPWCCRHRYLALLASHGESNARPLAAALDTVTLHRAAVVLFGECAGSTPLVRAT